MITPLPPAPIEVALVPAPPAPDTTALKAKAGGGGRRRREEARADRTDLREGLVSTEVACPRVRFTQIATDYQAYYAERPDLP